MKDVVSRGESEASSRVALHGLSLVPDASLPQACAASSGGLQVNVTVAGNPSVGTAETPTINYEMRIYVNITNTGPQPLALQSLHVPLPFSRAVQQPDDGTWTQALPEAFTITCWGLYVFSAYRTSNWRSVCNTTLSYAITDYGTRLPCRPINFAPRPS